MRVFLEPFQEHFSKAWWVFLKECSAFFGSNVIPLCVGIITFLCGLASALPYQKLDIENEDVIRLLFHFFYIIILVGSVFLSMSTFVSERRQGTLELLYTLPISDTQLVLGKFFMGVLIVFFIVIGMTVIYILWLGQAFWYVALTGGIGLFLAGLYAYSVGLFASSLSSNYLLSLLIATAIISVIDVGGYLSGLLPSPAKEILGHLHGLNHFFAFTRGVIPLKSFVFFSSLILLFLFLPVKVLESRRWRGTGN